MSPMPLRQRLRRSVLKVEPVRRFYVAQRFALERRLLRGAPVAAAPKPSVIHFSTNRAATQYVKSILTRCARANGMQPVRLAEYGWATNRKSPAHMTAEEFAAVQPAFRPKGFVYSAFGAMIDGIADLDNYRVLLVVRDPRDVLTSRYYSNTVSHPFSMDPDAAASFAELRDWSRSHSIDDYALARAPRLAEQFSRYAETLIGRPNVQVSRYEDMIADFPAWFDGMVAHCGLPVAPAVRSELIVAAAAATPQREQVDSHRRQVTPGDHARKLRPETVAALDRTLAPALDAFGYATG